MTAKLKLGGCAVAFFLAAGVAINVGPVQPSVGVEWKVEPKPQLSKEQSALAEHLATKYKQPAPLVGRIVRASYKEARDAGLSPLLVLAIIEKESSMRPDAVSSFGAVGLMQVVPRFHESKLESKEAPHLELKEPEKNIRVGVQVLAEYLTAKNGNLAAALRKYSGNATDDYAKRVSFFRTKLEKVMQESRDQET